MTKTFIEKAVQDIEDNPELYKALAGNSDHEPNHEKYNYLPRGYSDE